MGKEEIDGIAIIHRERLDGAKPEFFHYVLKSYADFYDPTINTLSLNNRCGFVIAINADTSEPVGCIIYKEVGEDEWHIVKSYTSEIHRGKGINGMLFTELKEKASQKGISAIMSNVNPKNESMIKALEKSDRKIVSYVTSYKIKKENEN